MYVSAIRRDRTRATAGGHRHQARVTDRLDADGYVCTPMAAVGGHNEADARIGPATGKRRCCTAHITP